MSICTAFIRNGRAPEKRHGHRMFHGNRSARSLVEPVKSNHKVTKTRRTQRAIPSILSLIKQNVEIDGTKPGHHQTDQALGNECERLCQQSIFPRSRLQPGSFLFVSSWFIPSLWW
jgi:hypothetical protein